MAAMKSGDDDDEGFGDFKFASFPNHTLQSGQINGRISTAAADDDDEWSDFVEYPLRNELSSGLSNAQSSSPNSFQSSKPFDPFGFFPDRLTKPSETVANPGIQSPSSGVKKEKSLWEKPRGALPLSIFGDLEDDEEQSGVDDPPLGNSKDYATIAKTGSDKHSGNLVNDIANLYSHSQQIKVGNELNFDSNGSNSDLNGSKFDSDMNGLTLNLSWSNQNEDLASQTKDFDLFTSPSNQEQLIKSENGLSPNFSGSKLNMNGIDANPNALNLDMNGATWSSVSELNWNTDRVGGDKDLDIFTNLYNQNQQKEAESGLVSKSIGLDSILDVPHSNNNGTDIKFQGSTSNFGIPNSNINGLNSNLGVIGANVEFEEEEEDDDDGWEFQDAHSEATIREEKGEVGRKGLENLDLTAYSSGFVNGTNGPDDLFAASNGFSNNSSEVDNGFDFKVFTVVQNGTNGPDDLFAASNGFSHNSSELDNGFDFKAFTVAQNGFGSDNSNHKQNVNDNGLVSDANFGDVGSDEDFGEFNDAFSETTLKQEVNELKSESKGALPLSIFGDEELQTDDSLDSQSIFTYQSFVYPRNGIRSQGSSLSVDDLISSLYSQAEPISLVDTSEKTNENGLNSSTSNVDLVNTDDDVNDEAWDFKDASFHSGAKEETFLSSPRDAHQNNSTGAQLNNYLDFYIKLNNELRVAVRCHLDNKEAQNTSAISGEDMKLAALGEDLQEVCPELYQENLLSKEVHSGDHPPGVICLEDFIEILHEPKFHILESEYHLSTRLPSAKKDLGSAIELLKHATSTLNVLKLASREEQSVYVSTWSKMITVCAQELKHGAEFWKQSLEKNVQSQILSESRGRQYIVALGEVYRVLVIIGVSTKVYKPWVLSNHLDPTGVYTLIEECHTLWRSSGLEAALQTMSSPIGVEGDKEVKSLLDSIKYVHDFDESALRNDVFSQHESRCRLSLLTSGTVPDMKMVKWNEEHYLLKLANFWANLVSCDTPKLPFMHVG